MRAFIKAALLVAAFVAIIAFSSPAVSTTPAVIEIGDADNEREAELAPSTALDTTFGAMAVRVVFEFVDTYVQTAMSAPGPDLQARLQQVELRPLIGAGQASAFHVLEAPAGALSDALASIALRIELHLAERSYDRAMVFPGTMLQDTVPPQISLPTSAGARVRWTTNEFTTSVIRYGATQEDLAKAGIDGELRKDHSMTLDGMGPGIMLYCQITSTDQSGNVAVSPIFQASGTHYMYLPSLKR